jgi:hypothetical protein
LPAWKLGRVVDCTGLENRQTERFPGFESLSFRQFTDLKPAQQGLTSVIDCGQQQSALGVLVRH